MRDFAAEARKKMDQLSSPVASERRKAAYYLGEAGVDEAITKLVTVYKTDEDPKVRQAAAYALGQFRAVEEALERGEQDKVVRLLKRVVDEGRMGRRASVRGMVIFQVFLLILFVGLVAANLFLPGSDFNLNLSLGGGGDTPANASAAARPALLAQIRPVYEAVRNDAATLRSELTALAGGGAMACNVFFNLPNLPADAVLDPANFAGEADLSAAVTALNTARTSISEQYRRYEGHCYDGVLIPAGEVAGVLNAVEVAQARLPGVERVLNEQPAAQTTASATPGTTDAPAAVTVEATPDATAEITATPVPVEDIIRFHARELFPLIDELRTDNVPLLIQHWTDARDAGTTLACRDAQPPVPDDYQLPAEDAAASPRLKQAVDTYNAGLLLLRQGWAAFGTACSMGNVSGPAGGELTRANQSLALLEDASTRLDALARGE
jgi:hypothetical protein